MGRIVVSGLGKAYRQYPTRWSRLAEWLLAWQPPRHTAHWVLRDVSFRIDAGEAVGIIGVNGAGKSTLLKLVTGTTLPTTGSVSVTGRLAAMLELGMGFHPDFTGRQNVLMAGQVLGLQEAQVRELMPEIEAFAEIGEYIDEPMPRILERHADAARVQRRDRGPARHPDRRRSLVGRRCLLSAQELRPHPAFQA